jgi:hypothetical protein
MSLSFEEGEKLLKEMGMTSEALDNMWSACLAGGHGLINQLDRSGKGWRDLNPHAIRTLPEEYRKMVQEGKITI